MSDGIAKVHVLLLSINLAVARHNVIEEGFGVNLKDLGRDLVDARQSPLHDAEWRPVATGRRLISRRSNEAQAMQAATRPTASGDLPYGRICQPGSWGSCSAMQFVMVGAVGDACFPLTVMPGT